MRDDLTTRALDAIGDLDERERDELADELAQIAARWIEPRRRVALLRLRDLLYAHTDYLSADARERELRSERRSSRQASTMTAPATMDAERDSYAARTARGEAK